MPRSRYDLPTEATVSVSRLFSMLEKDVRAIEAEIRGTESRRLDIRFAADGAHRHARYDREAIESEYRPPIPVTAETTLERRARESGLREARKAFDSARIREDQAAQDDIARLDSELDKLFEKQRVLRQCVRDLREAEQSAEGLAPWDRAFLEELRKRGELAPQSACDDEVMRGAEVVALVRETLCVSRSVYYERLRPLLREHFIIPNQLLYWSDGSVGLLPASAKRFRRDEVEALIRFLRTSSRR